MAELQRVLLGSVIQWFRGIYKSHLNKFAIPFHTNYFGTLCIESAKLEPWCVLSPEWSLPLPSSRKEFLMDSKVLVRDVTSLKKWTWVELDCLWVPVVFAVFFLKTASISWTKWLISPSRYLAHGSYWIIYDTSRATTLNHSIIMFICLENSPRWKHVVGFPHNKFCLLWSLDGYMKGSFPRVICICNHRVQWAWSITNIQLANCVRDSTYKGKFDSRRRLTYVKTRSLSSIVCSQNIHKWQITICGSSPKCHTATFLVYPWYIL